MVYVPDTDIDRLITDDAGFGDLTTTASGISDVPGVMRFSARHAMVACATEEAARLLARLGAAWNCLPAAAKLLNPAPCC
jgi:molybdenum transport protein